MSDQVQIVFGRPPWQPTPDSVLVTELDFWDRPTLGVIEQAGSWFLFRNFIGSNSDVELWIYSMLESWEPGQFADDHERDIDDLVQDVTYDRHLTLALTGEDSGVIAAVELRGASDEMDLAAAVREGLARMREGTDYGAQLDELAWS